MKDSLRIQSIKKLDISEQFFYNYINLIKTFRVTNIIFNDFIKIINELPNNHNIFVLLNDNFEIVGTITTIIERKIINNGKCVCHVEDLIISPHYKGKSYGSKLLEFVKTYSQKNGCYKIILNCSVDISNFYLKNNFKQNNIEMTFYLN